MEESYLAYNLALLFGVGFAWLSQKVNRYNNLFIVMSFFSIFMLSFLRFDVGYDYDNYVSSFKSVYNGSYESTNGFLKYSSYYWICKIFSFTKKGYILVFGFYSFFTLFFLFKALLNRGVLCVGVFIFITYNFLFISYDQIRQVLAISMFVYSIQFIEDGKFKKFIVTILLASIIHVSALAVIPFFFVRNVKPKLVIWSIIVLLFVIGYYSGLWESLREKFFELVPYYNFYANYQNQLTSAKLNSNIGVAFLILVSFILMFYLRKTGENILFYTTVFGIIIYLFASNNLNIWRFANYFLFMQCISIPIILKQWKSPYAIWRAFFIVTGCILFQMYILNSPRGTTPYRTIFSDRAKKELFNND